MKMFKRLFAVVAVLSMTFAMTICASAAEITAEEQAILDELSAGVEVDGVLVTVPADYMNQAEAYLLNEDVTAEECDEIMAQIDEAEDYVVKNNITDLSKMTSAQIDDVVEIAEKAAEVVDVTITVDTKTGTVTGVDASGKEVLSGKAPVKKTGMDVNATVVMAVALCAVVGTCVVVASKKNVFEA